MKWMGSVWPGAWRTRNTSFALIVLILWPGACVFWVSLSLSLPYVPKILGYAQKPWKGAAFMPRGSWQTWQGFVEWPGKVSLHALLLAVEGRATLQSSEQASSWTVQMPLTFKLELQAGVFHFRASLFIPS